jgi:site-specific DNA recombinase
VAARITVGALAHFLKNRFYIGEMVYLSEVYAGEHEPIVDRSTFDAVQVKLAEKVRARQVRVSHSPAILIGRIFDDRDNRMTLSHSNKDGVRYRYYVSHAVLQSRKQEAGAVARVPAAELEKIVVEAVRTRCAAAGQPRDELSDRELIDSHVQRLIVRPSAIDVELRGEQDDHASPIRLPWSVHAFVSVKSVLHQPDEQPTLKAEARDAILLAVAKARLWVDDLASRRVRSFAEIARSDGSCRPGSWQRLATGLFERRSGDNARASGAVFLVTADRGRRCIA